MSNNIEKKEQEDKTSFSYAFKQQVMKAWQPVPTIQSTIILFIGLTLFFLIFGIILISFSNDVKEYSMEYEFDCRHRTSCLLEMNVTKKMDKPVFVYYELENYYQNHRRYVKSRNVNQLQGDLLTEDQIKTDCEPIVTNRNINQKMKNYLGTGPDLDPDAPASPCGLIAKSFFNDSYVLIPVVNGINQAALNITSEGIAWPADKQNKFKRCQTGNCSQLQWLDVEDERFMVWMRTAALPHFRKSWGIINQDLEPGTYKINITNNYNVSAFNGKKHFVISTANAFGGKNAFLAIAYLVVGGICFVITIVFVVRKFQKKND